MATDQGPGAVVGWLQSHGTTNGLAGCAFLIGPDIVLTCAHVVGAHFGLRKPVPAEPPAGAVKIRFEALQDEVTGHVLPGGWFSNARPAPGRPSDIAVVRLSEPVSAIKPLPAIAQRMPTQSRPVLIHGAEADYKSYGQQVQGKMGGGNIPRGWRQIDPEDSARGFTVAEGFSGSPVLDDLGNVVWRMIVAVAEQRSGVAYAITAEDLRVALQAAGAETTVRFSDAVDRRAEEAMAKLREGYETQLALVRRDLEAERRRRELDDLRLGVRGLEQEAREAPHEEAAAALDALAGGDIRPATEALRRRMEERLATAGEARREAAAAARQLGTMLKLVDSAGALKAFRQAAACDPDDFWTWAEICQLEQVAGTLDGAAKAINSAFQVAAEDERFRETAFSIQGDVRFRQGNLVEAISSYKMSQTLAERLAGSDPGNAEWQRDLSISHERIGDVQRAQGDPAAALASYRTSLAIAERLAGSDPGSAEWQRDLSISHERIGNVQRAQGDSAAALASYRASLAIRKRLAGSDPGNAEWQRDLSISHNKIGDVQVAQGDSAAALASHRASLAIRERLAGSDPGNAEWQRDLAVSYGRVGTVEAHQDACDDALDMLRHGRDIIARLTLQSPDNAVLTEDLNRFDDEIASLENIKLQRI